MIPHGRRSKYTHEGCRCEACTSANTADLRRRQQQRRAYVAEHGLPSGVEHGASGYRNWGCRCEVCTAGNSGRALARILIEALDAETAPPAARFDVYNGPTGSVVIIDD